MKASSLISFVTCVAAVGCGASDTPAVDAGSADLGVLDMAISDSSVSDGAVTDGAVTDAAVTDSAVTDASTADLGVADGGDVDASCSVAIFSGATASVAYSLNDESGTNFEDRIATYDFTASGSATSVAGVIGNAVAFDGSSTYLTAAPPLPLTAFTWAGWVRLDALPSDTFGIIANHGNGPDAYTGWSLALTSTGVPTMFTEGGSADTEIGTASSSALVLGAWTHVAVTFDAGDVTLYLDGVERASTTLTYSALVGSTNPFVLGRDVNSGGRYFAGAIDEVGYWDSALSETEIGMLVADGLCGLTSY